MSGYLDNGQWREGWYDTAATKGEFVRSRAAFRDWISADGASGFPAAAGRYHLYVSLACPWAHRTLIVRALKKLEDAIAVSVVEPVMSDQGWAFSAALPDRANGFSRLHQLYTAARPDYSGRVTVPVLWDGETRTIVNNESAEIIRMFNAEFDAFGDAGVETDTLLDPSLSLYRLYAERLGHSITDGQASIRLTRADALVADSLGIPAGSPILRLEQVDATAEGEPVLFSVESYVADTFEFGVHRRGPALEALPTRARPARPSG